ncbi:MAG: glucosidase [Vulcanimicrobiaceae bacterium]
MIHPNPEKARLEAAERQAEPWRRWGPYLSCRQWGTVREDYSADGNAWDSFPFEMARLRAYRWGEDGILGISDDHQRLCFAPAFWNEHDEILKERLYGLNGHQGNHGEDVKECWWFLDGTPTASYLKGLYRYPQRAFPYAELREENARRGREDREYELVDTGIFADDAFFDIVVEYAKRDVEDVCVRITAINRGKSAAPLHLLPQLWFRNEWSWRTGTPRPTIREVDPGGGALAIEHATLGKRWLFADGDADETLFTENETDFVRAFGAPNPSPYVKSGIDRAVRGEGHDTVNPARVGSKAALHYRWLIEPGGARTVRLRLSDDPDAGGIDRDFDAIFQQRELEADHFYAAASPQLDAEATLIQRRAFAGLIWSEQFYNYVVRDWLEGDPTQPPPPPQRKHGRNANWRHLYNDDVLSMPDTWEYPWYAAWDLAFHVIPLGLIDPTFAKKQLVTLTREWYMHPSGQLPAYEWAFDDVNPPVHAWAALRLYRIEARRNGGIGDYRFLERVFQKLLMNFTWWVNRKDVVGRNVFQGGFLGLDNVGPFDRSAQFPAGTYLAQSDGTSWMGVYALNLLAISIELAKVENIYEDVASKFFAHFLIIADAMNSLREDDLGLWDPEDEFYYDQLYLPDGERIPVKVRSVVGITPIFAVETLGFETLERLPRLRARIEWYLQNRPELTESVARIDVGGLHERRLLAICSPNRLRRILRRVFDEREFLSPHGVRMLSRFHLDHPYALRLGGQEFRCDYEPAESTSGLFGGNSNWRGPVWMPMNFLLIEALQKFHYYLGDDYRVEFPTGSGRMLNLWECSLELSRRQIALFRRDEHGRRPFNGENELFQTDLHWRDQILFNEYFNGDTGEGLGASHQTGWTSLVAKMIDQLARYTGQTAHPHVAADVEVTARM